MPSSNQLPALLLIPSVPVWMDGEEYLFDRKFYDGLTLYCELWGGKVGVVMRKAAINKPDFGLVAQTIENMPFGFKMLETATSVSREHLDGADIVLASGDSHDQFKLSGLCQMMQAKCVYIIECIPETRYQIIDLTTNNVLVKFRRKLYVWLGERKRERAFLECDGLQANGVAAKDYYQGIPNSLLYFDTRIESTNVIDKRDLDARLEQLDLGNPLRLAFSGRIMRMKGVDHLVNMARLLQLRGIPFVLDIYGDGDYLGILKKQITEYDLGKSVNCHGAVNFESELVPAIKQEVDVFVCLHRQSDPSCTYLETLSCGVPILGYSNKAFAGIIGFTDVGWGAPLGDVDQVVNTIEYLHQNRDEIKAKARKALGFAKEHTFDKTFKRRVQHLEQTLLG